MKIVLVLFALLSALEARTVSGPHRFRLLESINSVAGSLVNQASHHPPRTDSQIPVPKSTAPGRDNICDSLCPKWCQKVNSTESTQYTNCHYLCGNICYDKTTSINPFVGNSRYEVVPSDFDFSKYDLNGDKLISVNEFCHAEKVDLSEVLDLFIFVDLDEDGFIDTQEFQGGPLVFTVQMAAELSAMARERKTTPKPFQL